MSLHPYSRFSRFFLILVLFLILLSAFVSYYWYVKRLAFTWYWREDFQGGLRSEWVTSGTLQCVQDSWGIDDWVLRPSKGSAMYISNVDYVKIYLPAPFAVDIRFYVYSIYTSSPKTTLFYISAKWSGTNRWVEAVLYVRNDNMFEMNVSIYEGNVLVSSEKAETPISESDLNLIFAFHYDRVDGMLIGSRADGSSVYSSLVLPDVPTEGLEFYSIYLLFAFDSIDIKIDYVWLEIEESQLTTTTTTSPTETETPPPEQPSTETPVVFTPEFKELTSKYAPYIIAFVVIVLLISRRKRAVESKTIYSL
jgi:hypothetical protein